MTAASTTPSSPPQDTLHPTMIDELCPTHYNTQRPPLEDKHAIWSSSYINQGNPTSSAGSMFWMPNNNIYHKQDDVQEATANETCATKQYDNEDTISLDLFTFNMQQHQSYNPSFTIHEEQAPSHAGLNRTLYQVGDGNDAVATALRTDKSTSASNADPNTPSSTTSLIAPISKVERDDDRSIYDNNSNMMPTLHQQQRSHNDKSNGSNDRSYLLCSKLQVTDYGNVQREENEQHHQSFAIPSSSSPHNEHALSPLHPSSVSSSWWATMSPLASSSSPSLKRHPQQPASLSFSDSDAVLNFLQSESDPFPQPNAPPDTQQWMPPPDERSMVSQHSAFNQQQHHEGSSYAMMPSNGGSIDTGNHQLLIDNVKQWLRSHLRNYLLAPNPVAMGERTIVILTGKVAQKSYGTEKRFLCPPPTVILSGSTWWSASNNEGGGGKVLPPILKVVMSTETSEIQEGQVDWYSTSGALVGQTGFPPPPPPPSPALHVAQQPSSCLSGRNSHGRIRASFDRSTISTTDRDWYRIPKGDPLVGGKCVLKQLYVNDVEEGRRKQVECLARIHLADGTMVGTLASRSIKVISKPSKKRHNSANLDSCIRHGTLVSLFNRIRSQTVSTKYLGVSASPCQSNSSATTLPFIYPGQCHGDQPPPSKDKCFSARTGSWEPFVIWLVDTQWKPEQHPNNGHSAQRQQASGRQDDIADEYIGANCASTLRGGVPYPSPPAIAIKNRTHQPLTIHYNQHVVLQCLTTGLVSPVMIIRKVDRASNAVFGGASIRHCYPHASKSMYGGEFGDEVLGEPVSQLHKVAFQMVTEDVSASGNRHHQNDSMPQCGGSSTYLACFHDTVGMHRTSNTRKPMPHAAQQHHDLDTRLPTRRRIASMGGNSAYIGVPHLPTTTANDYHQQQDLKAEPRSFQKRSRSISGGEGNIRFSSSAGVLDPTSWTELGAYWSEKVPDSTIWTIVGTECAKYTIWQPSPQASSDNPQHMIPRVFSYSRSPSSTAQKDISDPDSSQEHDYISLYGEHFSDQLDVWFGDVRSSRCEHVGRGQIVCKVPPKNTLINAVGVIWKNERLCRIPLLLATKDGKAVYKANKHYAFSP